MYIVGLAISNSEDRLSDSVLGEMYFIYLVFPHGHAQLLTFVPYLNAHLPHFHVRFWLSHILVYLFYFVLASVPVGKKYKQ